jgi:TrmH family RNA methyltransferase
LGPTHDRVRRLRRLTNKRSDRWEEGACVLEGPDLIDAALESGVEVEALYLEQRALTSAACSASIARAQEAGVPIFTLPEGTLLKVADTKSPQPLLATAKMRVSGLPDLPTDRALLILDNIRDPGNAGTMVRSADAAGVGGVLFTGDCVDPFNPKTLRSSAGSVFHLPIVVGLTLGDAVAALRSAGVPSYATVVRDAKDFRSVNMSAGCAIVIGNESSGLLAEEIALCDDAMTITMAGKAESLNAGVAASLILFEALHQRVTTNA